MIRVYCSAFCEAYLEQSRSDVLQPVVCERFSCVAEMPHTSWHFCKICLTVSQVFNTLIGAGFRGPAMWIAFPGKKMKILKFCLFSLFVGLLSACAVPAKVEPVAQVRHPVELRAEARWSAMVAKDFSKAYTFLSPGSKSANTEEQFRLKFRPLNWVAARAVSSECDAEKCRVKVAITITDPRLGGEVTTVYEEVWLQDSNQWWLVFN